MIFIWYEMPESKFYSKYGSREVSKVAGFFVFSHKYTDDGLFLGRLCWLRINECPTWLEIGPYGLEIGEKIL